MSDPSNVTSLNSGVVDPNAIGDVIDAMRSIQTEDDRWHLAEALRTMIPSGLVGFDKIVDQATSEGVLGKMKVSTLRQYRDAASRWPADKRVANVSFTAHREAMADAAGIDSARKMLTDMAKAQGASNVSAAAVRKAISIKNGRPSAKKAAAAKAAAAASSPVIEVLTDIKTGGKTLVQSIGAATPLSELDELQAGLKKVLTHVERLQGKARQKAQAAAKKAIPEARKALADAKAGQEAGPAKRAAKAGDLRGVR